MKLDHNLHKSQHFCLYKKGLGVYTLLVCIILNNITAFLPLKVIIIMAGKICDLGKQKNNEKEAKKKKKISADSTAYAQKIIRFRHAQQHIHIYCSCVFSNYRSEAVMY